MATIYLGIGAQKAGTSWLFHQIKRGVGFRQGLGKEYHVLDSLYVPHLDDFAKVFSNEILALKENSNLAADHRAGAWAQLRRVMTWLSRQDKRRIARKKRLIGMISGKENYFDYIASKLSSPDSFTADFTPSYSALTAEHLESVRQEFARRNVRVRVIYILRDPVCRLESSVRMGMRNENILTADNGETAVRKMLSYGGSDHERSRSNYPEVVRNLDTVFPPADVFIGFYEELFTSPSMAAVAEFCGIDPGVFDSSRYYNHSASYFKYPRKLILELYARYRDVYEFVEQRFQFDLRLWTESRAQLVKD